MFVVSKHLEIDGHSGQDGEIVENGEESLGRDLTSTLLKVIQNSDGIESESIVKSALINMVFLQKIYPQVQKELKELVLDFNERLKHEAIPQLFTVKNGECVNPEVIGFLIKYNIVMSQASLRDASDSDFVKGMASFGVANFT